MTADRWELVQSLFAGAMERPAPDRAAYLAQATDDPAIRAEVESLLDAADQSGRLDGITEYLAPPAGPTSGTHLLQRLQTALADRYRIQREHGRGGAAIVYLADDLKHHRPVALKLLRPEVGGPQAARRFLREIETVARLAHPHILALHDSGEADGLSYYVMPFIEGETLRDRLSREFRLSLADTVSIAEEIADALTHAHGLGIVHRDIKPGNILFAAGHALVADFGIARALDAAAGDRLTESGTTIGTPAYMSPEQASARQPIDGRADIYSLGCVVYEMLAGQPPFTGTNQRILLTRHALDPVPPLQALRPEVPLAMQRVIERALAKSVEDRFGTAREFVDALERSVHAPAVEAAPPPQPKFRRILAASLVAAVLFAGWWVACR